MCVKHCSRCQAQAIGSADTEMYLSFSAVTGSHEALSHSSFNFERLYSTWCSHAHTHSEFLSQRRSVVLIPDNLVFCVFTMLSDSSIVNILPALKIKNRHSEL